MKGRSKTHLCVMVVVAVVLVVGCLLLLVRLSTPPVKSAPKAVFVLVDYKAVYLCLHASAFSLLCFLFFTHTHTLILVLVYICTGHRKTTWLFSLRWHGTHATQPVIPLTVCSSRRMFVVYLSITYMSVYCFRSRAAAEADGRRGLIMSAISEIGRY